MPSLKRLLGLKSKGDDLPPDFPRNADGTPKKLTAEEWRVRIAEKQAAMPKGSAAFDGKDGNTARVSGFTMSSVVSGI